MIPHILSIAGTDPTGGAGIQADLKAIAAAGGYGMSVVTSLVVQNTQGVQEVHTPEPAFLRAQLEAVSSDVEIDAIKIGMLSDAASTNTVTDWLDTLSKKIPVIVDPVMVASSGDSLAESVSLELLKRANIITPNLDELALLLEEPPATTQQEMVFQAQKLAKLTGSLILAKGGHLESSHKGNILVSALGEIAHAASPQVQTTASHGTGCSLSSALATRIALGESLAEAVQWSTRWVREALQFGEDQQVGKGNGPIDHFHRLRRQAEFSIQHIQAPVRGNSFSPVVNPAGTYTQQMWDVAGTALERFTSDGFVPSLIDGSLHSEQFRFYLEQDDYYLQVYGSVLAGLASKARDRDERLFWASSVCHSIAVEQDMHAAFGLAEHIEPSQITLAYTDFLRAEASSDYVVAVAAVLPCFWLYAQLSDFVAEEVSHNHPYRLWIETYRDLDFQKVTAQAVALVEKQMATASESQRERALHAFWRACILEADFFAQAMLRDPL